MSTPYEVSGDAEGGRNGAAAVDHGQEEAASVSNLGPGRVLAHVTMLAWVHDSERLRCPADLAAIISKVVEVMASGGTITIGSLPKELSTNVAAEQLCVSRPTLMKMIRAGEIPAHKVGSHHRLKAADVLTVKRARLERQRRAFDELRELEDELEQF